MLRRREVPLFEDELLPDATTAERLLPSARSARSDDELGMRGLLERPDVWSKIWRLTMTPRPKGDRPRAPNRLRTEDFKGFGRIARRDDDRYTRIRGGATTRGG